MFLRPDTTLLVLAPHTDDAELGCGATIARALEQQVRVHVAAFSIAEASLPPGVPPDTLEREYRAATETLGVPKEWVYVHRFPVRRLSYHRQEVLDELVRLRASVDPQVVILPAGTDLHQDHQVLFAEGLRAFKHITVLGYELPWNHVDFAAQAFVRLERRHVDTKWLALQHYKTQIGLGRSYFTEEFIYGLARVRGTQVQCTYAEAFQLLRAVA